MILNDEGKKLIKDFEGLKLEAYLDVGGVPTIGYGTIKYPNGNRVKIGDKITKEQADEYFESDIKYFTKNVSKAVSANLNSNQFSALVSFTYNLGIGNLSKSTLLKRVNLNPNDPEIANEFAKWINVNGKPVNGLKRRRQEESKLYFKK